MDVFNVRRDDMNAALDTVRHLALEGLSCKSIASRVGLHYLRVYRQLRNEGLMRAKPQLPQSIREKIIEDLNVGQLSFSDIARKYLVNRSTVLRISRKCELDIDADDDWSGDVIMDEIDIRNTRSKHRCAKCGAMIRTVPCLMCEARQVKNATN